MSSGHLVRVGRASISIIIIIIVVGVIIVLGCFGRRRGRLHKATKASLPSSNMAPTQVFTWYSSVESVSRQASMRWSCTMIVSRVIPPAEVEGAEVDGAEGVGEAAVLDLLERNYASFRLTVATSMAHITWKWSETGKGIEKWRKILLITNSSHKAHLLSCA